MPKRRKLKVPQETASFLRGLHPDIKRKVKAALGDILEDPECGKALKDNLKGLKSLRVGRFRIIYRAAKKNVIEVVAFGPRAAIYKDTYRLIKRNTSTSGSFMPASLNPLARNRQLSHPPHGVYTPPGARPGWGS